MQLLGVRIDNLTIAETLDKVRDFIDAGRQHYIVTINPEIIVLAQKDDEFRKILNKADLAIADGTGIVWAARRLGESLKERVAGVDLISRIMNQESGIKNQIFLLGGRYGVAKKIAGQRPVVVGFSEDLVNAVSTINHCQPNVLFVAMGAPRQEKWIADNLAKTPSVKVAIGVGGAFDMISGRISRAPSFMQKIGLEWLWRLILQPSRIGRIINATVVFPWMVLRSKLKASH